MTTAIRLPLALALLLAGPVAALAEHETPEAHQHGATKTIMVDNTDIRPEATQMDHGDVIAFLNSSTHPVKITFTEPADLEKKIRCGLVREAKDKGRPAAPWALFTWVDGKLVGNVPPGQFGSVCSLDPGKYTFTAERIGVESSQHAGRAGVLAPKGTIEVK